MLNTFEQSHLLNIQLPAFRLIHAQRLLRTRQYKEALIQLQLVMKSPTKLLTKQHRTFAAFGMGRCFYQLKKYKQAKTKFKQVLKLDPVFYRAQDFLGRTLFALKEYQQAQNKIESLLQKNPDSQQIRKFLAIIYLNKGQHAKADRLFLPKYKEEPRWDGGYFLHAQAYTKSTKPNYKKAFDLIQKALKLSPQTPHYLALKARILRSLGQPEKAKKALKEAIQQEAPPIPSAQGIHQTIPKVVPNQHKLGSGTNASTSASTHGVYMVVRRKPIRWASR